MFWCCKSDNDMFLLVQYVKRNAKLKAFSIKFSINIYCFHRGSEYLHRKAFINIQCIISYSAFPSRRFLLIRFYRDCLKARSVSKTTKAKNVIHVRPGRLLGIAVTNKNRCWRASNGSTNAFYWSPMRHFVSQEKWFNYFQ